MSKFDEQAKALEKTLDEISTVQSVFAQMNLESKMDTWHKPYTLAHEVHNRALVMGEALKRMKRLVKKLEQQSRADWRHQEEPLRLKREVT